MRLEFVLTSLVTGMDKSERERGGEGWEGGGGKNMQRTALHNCLQTQRGPFATDKGFPSEPDSTGSIKVMVRTWCFEALRIIVVMFLIICSVFGSLLFLAGLL